MKISSGYTKPPQIESRGGVWSIRFLLYVLSAIIILHILECYALIHRPGFSCPIVQYLIADLCNFVIPVCTLWTRLYSSSTHIENCVKYLLVIIIISFAGQFLGSQHPINEEEWVPFICYLIAPVPVFISSCVVLHMAHYIACRVCKRFIPDPSIRIARILTIIYAVGFLLLSWCSLFVRWLVGGLG